MPRHGSGLATPLTCLLGSGCRQASTPPLAWRCIPTGPMECKQAPPAPAHRQQVCLDASARPQAGRLGARLLSRDVRASACGFRETVVMEPPQCESAAGQASPRCCKAQ
mmetsp:Transcript_100117/g.312924  ORF Transcript_100117/g.312924 Transcript_100117/m.312924 type:complete len:109 (-) Transcript_100117:718-1044(-)